MLRIVHEAMEDGAYDVDVRTGHIIVLHKKDDTREIRKRERRGKNPGSIQRPYATLVPVLGPTWHGPQNLFVMEKKNQRKKKCI